MALQLVSSLLAVLINVFIVVTVFLREKRAGLYGNFTVNQNALNESRNERLFPGAKFRARYTIARNHTMHAGYSCGRIRVYIRYPAGDPLKI